MPYLPEWMQSGKRIEQAQREFAQISALIQEVRRCWTAEDYRTDQQHVGVLIEWVDAAVGSANKRLAHTEKQLRRARQQDLPLDSKEVIQAQSDLDQVAFDCELNLRLGRQNRMVGDAVPGSFMDSGPCLFMC